MQSEKTNHWADEKIYQNIQKRLDELERREDVKILHCVESGSRAWGFASPDSDYDVRFIYMRNPAHYLRLDKASDVIDWELNDVYDINGWDIRKALQLLHKSNPTLFEWSSSPLVYRTSPDWESVRNVLPHYFLSKSGLYHYLSTAKNNYREYLKTEEVKLKKYFYVLRPVLACRWILDRNTPPPMLFSELMEAELDKSMYPVVEELLRLKMQTPEIGTGKRIDSLNLYLEQQMEELHNLLTALPDVPQRSWSELNVLFRVLFYNW